tara:strand:- start:3806 stop:4909 length:1104 start_codon:yes stop_codon:yes gene_type:complete
MRIAFLSTFYPFRGGIAQFNGALFRALEKDHEVKAYNFTTQYPSMLFPGKTQFVDENDQADKIPSERVLNSMNPASYGQTARKIKEFKPDLVIIGYWMPYMAPSLGYVAGKLSKDYNVVSIVHNATPHEKGKFDKRLSSYFFKRNDKCIALSEAVKSDIERNYPSIDVKVLLHPVYEHFGVKVDKIEAIKQLKIPRQKKYILFFGLIRDYKGLDLLIDAMKFLPTEYHLVIAGESYGSFDKYQEQIKLNNLNDRVHLHLRYIPDSEVKFFFSMSDVVALPYRSATQSGIVAIAKHFNKPVVATNVGGLSEFLNKPGDGVLAATQSPKDIAAAIKRVLEEDESNKDRTQKESYSWDDFGKELINFAKS